MDQARSASRQDRTGTRPAPSVTQLPSLITSLLVAPVGMLTIAGFIWRQFEQGSVGLGMTMSFIAIVLTTLIPMLLIGALRYVAGERFTGLH